MIDLPESDLCLLLDALDQLPPIPEVGRLRTYLAQQLEVNSYLKQLAQSQSSN